MTNPETAAIDKSIKDLRQKLIATDSEARQEQTSKDRQLQAFDSLDS
jgi:hypothetical protein